MNWASLETSVTSMWKIQSNTSLKRLCGQGAGARTEDTRESRFPANKLLYGQTGPKSNNRPFHTVLQYFKILITKTLGGSHQVQKYQTVRETGWRGLINTERKLKRNVRHWKRSQSPLIWCDVTSIPQNIKPHLSAGIFLENTNGIIHVGFHF